MVFYWYTQNLPFKVNVLDNKCKNFPYKPLPLPPLHQKKKVFVFHLRNVSNLLKKNTNIRMTYFFVNPKVYM